MTDKKKYLIISCDGGGIRGVITTALLKALGQQTLDNTDLFSGTSTGSIIAVGLAGGITIDDLFKIYTDPALCQEFFSPYRPGAEQQTQLESAQALLENIETDDGNAIILEALKNIMAVLLFPLFSNTGRQNALDTAFGAVSGLTIGEIWNKTGKRVVAPTFVLDQPLPRGGRKQWFSKLIHNLPNLPDTGDYDAFTTVDAAMCSSSAPVLYESVTTGGSLRFADGGLFANTPSTAAVAALQGSGILAAAGLSLNDVFVLSVGTGFNPSSYPIPALESPIPGTFPWGLLGWFWPEDTRTVSAFPLVQAVFDGTSQVDSVQCPLLVGVDNFRRANVVLDQNVSLFDCNAVGTLLDMTEAYMETDEWNEIAEWVELNFS